MKYKAVTTKVGVNGNGVEYTADIIQTIAKQCKDKIVTLGIDGPAVGIVVSEGLVENDMVSMTINIVDKKTIDILTNNVPLFAGTVGIGKLVDSQIKDFELKKIAIIQEHAFDVPPLKEITEQ